MPATATFPKKSVWHSDLVKASTSGLAIMLVGPVRDSKFAGKPPYVVFKVHGEDTDHTLSIENDGIKETLSGIPANTWVVIRAEGTRDQAYIMVEDAQGNVVLRGTAPKDIAQPAQASLEVPPANEWREVTGPHPVELDPKLADARAKLAERYYLSLCAAQEAITRFANDHGGMQPSDAVRNAATTLFINGSTGR